MSEGSDYADVDAPKSIREELAEVDDYVAAVENGAVAQSRAPAGDAGSRDPRQYHSDSENTYGDQDLIDQTSDLAKLAIGGGLIRHPELTPERESEELILPMPRRETGLAMEDGVITQCWCGDPMYRVAAIRYMDPNKPVDMMTLCAEHLETFQAHNRPKEGIAGIETWDLTTAKRYARMGAKGIRIEHFADQFHPHLNPTPGGYRSEGVPDAKPEEDNRIALIGAVLQAVEKWSEAYWTGLHENMRPVEEKLDTAWKLLKAKLDADAVDTSRV